MSLQHAAKHLEKHGRNGDTVLVHMSKGEVKSLNDLAMAGGGYLTINPHTGLPEAGFLKRMLPTLVGAGLMMVPGMQPAAAAMIVGGGTAVATGSLKKGLMAGLGAYGGAGMAGSLGAAGASSVVPEAAATAAPEAAAVATPPAPVVDPTAPNNFMRGDFSTVPQAAPPVPVNPATSLRGISTSAPVVEAPVVEAPAPVVEAPASVVEAPVARIEVAPTQLSPAPATNAQTLRAQQNLFSGSDSLTTAPTTGVSPTNSLRGNYSFTSDPVIGAASPAPAPLVEAAPETLSTNPADYKNFEAGVNKYGAFGESPTNIDFKDMTASQRFEALKKGTTFDNLGDWASNNKMQAYGLGASLLMPEEKAREKKPVDSDPGQQFEYQANATSPTPMSDPYGREQKYYNQRYVPRAAGGGMMASGGISDAHYNLGGYSDGGRLLRGPGDGVSDSIPAVIGKKQPARLADGEFVIPARIVSELGNGSTEAGARKLYAMMDRIQKARGKTVGKGKVAKNSRSEKYLPA